VGKGQAIKHQHHHSAKTGSFLALACAVHCMMTPVLLTALPVLGSSFIINPFLEIGLIIGSTVLSGTSLVRSYQVHKIKTPLVWLLTAVLLIITSQVLFDKEGLLSIHTILNVASGVCILVSILIDRRLLNRCSVH
jgi:hypothetical protein